MAAVAAAAAPAAQQCCFNSFVSKWDNIVDWTNTNGINTKDWLTIGNVEGTLKKVAKVVLALLPLVLNAVAACFGAAFASIKKCLIEDMKVNVPAQAPPAAADAAAAAAGAAAQAAVGANAPAAAVAVAPQQ